MSLLLLFPHPAVAGNHNLAADDVESASEVSTPALGQVHALLANDVESASEVSSPSLTVVGAEVKRQTGGRTRKKGRRYIVEIDGQYFPVANISDAEALLMQARQMAEEAAPRDVGRATVRIKPPRVAIKTASGAETTSVTLKREVKRTQEIINKIYRDAYESIERTREISRLLHKKLEEEDEEEAILALLM